VVLSPPGGGDTDTGAGRTPRPEWFRWLALMHDAVGEKFVAGITLYTGDQVLPYGDRLLAVPMSALWELLPGKRGGHYRW